MAMKVRKTDLIWTYIGTILTLGINFIIIPILMRFLSQDSLGLWQVFASIGSIALLLDFGFSPTLARNIAYIWSGANDLKKTGAYTVTENREPNYEMLNKVLKVCQRIYLIISLVSLFALSTIGTVYIIHITREFEGYRHLLAWGIYVIAVFMNLYFYYCSAALIGIGQVGNNSKAKACASLIQIVACLILCLLKLDIIAPCIAYLLFGLFFRGLARRRFYRTNNLKEKLKKVSSKVDSAELKRIFLTIWHNAWRDGLVALSNYLIGQANTIICSLFYSLQETAIYSLSLQFVQAIGIVSAVTYSTFQPKLQEAYVKEDKEETNRLMSLSVVTYSLVFILCFSVLVTAGIPILKLVSSSYVFNIPMLFGLGVYMYLQRRYIMYCSYISNTNEVPYVKAFVLSGILSIILSILFNAFLPIGTWGLVLGQFISQSIYNNWYWSKKVKKMLGLHVPNMIKSALNDYKKIFRSFRRKANEDSI